MGSRVAKPAETLILKAKGLSRYADPLSVRVPGSLNMADNVVIDQEGLFSARRGFERLGGLLTNGQAKGIVAYSDALLVYSDASGGTYRVLSRYDETAGSFTAYTSTATSGFRSTDAYVKSAEMSGNIYFTSSQGVYKLAALADAALTEAGVPEALHFTAVSTTTGSAVTAAKFVGYKHLWGIKDSNDNLVLGSPSNSVIYQQGPAASDVTIVVPVPAEITTSHFVQLYKTDEFDTSGAVGDEYKLVYEELWVSGTTMSIVDQTPNSLRASGAGLYTNATREGSQARNNQPPKCSDMVAFNNHMFYADVEYKQSFEMQLLATGSSAAYGLLDGDTVTLVRGGVTEVYTAKSYTGAAKEFQLYPVIRTCVYSKVDYTTNESFEIAAHNLVTGDAVTVSTTTTLPAGLTTGVTYYVRRLTSSTIAFYSTYAYAIASATTGRIDLTDAGAGTHTVTQTSSPAIDIRKTAEALVYSINVSGALFYAFYDSGNLGLPGLIRIEERDFSSSAFTIAASSGSGNSWSPNIGTTQSSTNEEVPNGLAWSKMGEPEAVPAFNIQTMGSKKYPIKRILALRESLFIFKGDGIWRLTGTSSSNFVVDAFNSSTKIVAPNTLCVLNNLVFGLFDQGVCQVSESGVSAISLNIEGDIRGWIGGQLTDLGSLSFGLPYETDRKYLMWVPTGNEDTYPTKGYCYNTVTDSWTVFDRTAWAGVVNPYNDRLYLASGATTYLSKERKQAVYSDFSDEQIDVVCSAVVDTGLLTPDTDLRILTLNTITGIAAGDMYYESDAKFAKILSVDAGATQVTVDSDLDWLTAPLEYLTVSSVLAKVLTVDSTNNIDIGDIYWEVAAGKHAAIIKVDRVNNTITLYDDQTWVTGTVAYVVVTPEVRKSYLCTIEWNPIHLNTPGHLKQWFEALVLLTSDFNTATLSFKTEQDSGWEGVDLTGAASDAWGLFPWGEAPWGGGGGTEIGHRTYVPRNKQRSGTIHVMVQIDTIFSPWEMSGFELTYRDAGERLLRK